MTADEIKYLALEYKFASDAETTGAFKGIAAAYGNVDHGGDIFAPGAFAATIAEHKAAGARPALLRQHDPMHVLGVIDSFIETPDGLVIKGRLALDTVKGAEAYSLLKLGALRGLSVGYRVTRATRDTKGVRTITSAYLGEVSFDFANVYRIYDRVSISLLRDPYTVATKGLVRFHARRRLGGAVVRAEAIRKLKISTA